MNGFLELRLAKVSLGPLNVALGENCFLFLELLHINCTVQYSNTTRRSLLCLFYNARQNEFFHVIGQHFPVKNRYLTLYLLHITILVKKLVTLYTFVTPVF